jgi:hypothetical protein
MCESGLFQVQPLLYGSIESLIQIGDLLYQPFKSLFGSLPGETSVESVKALAFLQEIELKLSCQTIGHFIQTLGLLLQTPFRVLDL